MCGFVGYLLPEGASHPDLEAWSDGIRHRGPDQGGAAVDGRYGVGTRRLSIQDLSPAGSQPMRTDRYVLAFNGEIYNHLELRAELAASGARAFRGHSDTETILRAVEQWGIGQTLARLNGMFALAIWDRVEDELTLARDPLGVKPLYYLRAGGGLYFGSELKALAPFSSRNVSPEGLALYLYFGFVPAPYSLVEGVRKVRPGEALVFRGSSMERTRIVPEAWTRPAAPGSAEERLQQVRAAVEAAVERQLLADVPVGLFLSGGVDSCVIAALAAARNPDLVSFSIRPESAAADPGAAHDAEIAARFARKLGLSHHEVLLRPEQLANDVEELLDWIDEPVSELYFAAEVLLSRKAREVGVPVVLTGHGGDEVFLGYPTYEAALKGDRYNAVPFFGPVAGTLAHAPGLAPNVRRNLQGAAAVWRKDPVERYAIVSAVHFSIDDVIALTGLAPDRVRELVQSVLSDALEAVTYLPNGAASSSAELFARMDMLLKVPEHYNMRLDRATMSASVEARVPLQDLELIGLVARLPHQTLMSGGLKGLLKQAFADVVPAEVLSRRKQTFQAPMLSWIRGPLAPWVDAQRSHMPAMFQASLPAWKAPRSTGEAYRSWSLGTLEAWRRALRLEY